jgi:site-specific recombinase XerC
MEDEGEVTDNPMRRMKPPAVPDKPVGVLTEEHLKRLLAVCAGRDFKARRDTALIMLLLDSGGRLAEISEMRPEGCLHAPAGWLAAGPGLHPWRKLEMAA